MSNTERLVAEAVERHRQGKLTRAKAIYQQVVEQSPGHALAWFGLGSVNAQLGEAYEAIVQIERAMALTGPRAEYHHNIAEAKSSVGRFEEADAHFREAIRLRPDYHEAYFNYANAKRFEPHDELHGRVRAQIDRADLSVESRRYLHFAAGKLCDDIGHYDAAFEHYRTANRLRAAEFDSAGYRAFVDASIEAFTRGPRTAVRPRGDPHFVFVVGMPRSGTTLVEQILASHSAVFGAGELPDVVAITAEIGKHATDTDYPQCMVTISPEVAPGYGRAYRQRVAGLERGVERYIDKQPNNFRFLGLIRAMLPGAAIIHCRRDPLDTCLSCYFQNFRSGQEWSFDLQDLATYHAGYRRLMAFWSGHLDPPMLEVEYETLVEQPEAVAREMIRHIGLEWEPGCLDYRNTRRIVQTASRWQVRQPITHRAVGRARAYAAHQDELVDALTASW